MVKVDRPTGRRRWRPLLLGCLSGILLCSATSVSYAQGCSSSCSGETCNFQGLLNVPLGEADLSITEQCHLLVDNIGPSMVGGDDGVVQTSLSSVYMKTTLATPNFSQSILGTEANIRQLGIVDALPGGEIMLTRIFNFDGDTLGLIINCQALSVAGYSIDIYNGSVLVGHVDHPGSAPIMSFPKTDLKSIACGIYPDSDVYTVLELGAPVPITVLTGTNPGPFVGDMLFVEAFEPSALATVQTDIENRFLDTGPVTMESMVALGSLPCEGVFPFEEPCLAAVPAVSPTGQLVMVVAVMAAGSVLLSRRRRVLSGES